MGGSEKRISLSASFFKSIEVKLLLREVTWLGSLMVWAGTT